ncbi:MAG: hypothetical protein ACLRMZ_21230 [Blautia marasmi]
MFEFVKYFYTVVGVLFVIYLLGYSTFLIASVIAGSLDLYKESKEGTTMRSIMTIMYRCLL